MEAENMRKKITTGVALLVAGLLLCTTPARAALLTVPNTLFPAPAEAGPVGATALLSTGPVPFASLGNFSGTLTSTVYTNDASNPFGPNAMTFVYELTNDSTSVNAIARMTLGFFDGFQTDASYEPGPGLPPTLIDRLTSDTVGFSFSQIGPGPLMPGMATTRLVIQTDAPAFFATTAAVIDSGQVSGILALGPAIPEPASLGLLSLAAFGLARRRK